MPKFSVIVPIYNIEALLPQCVDSLISQSYSDVEIILVDDGSPDNCGQICDRYGLLDKRIKVIHKQNGGLVSARQAGCEAAIGDYILNVDGDDWVTTDYLNQLDAIVQQYEPDCVCFGSVYVRDGMQEKHQHTLDFGLYGREDIEKSIFPLLIERADNRYFNPAVWAKAIKREIYIDCQMSVDKKIKIGEDHACTKPAIYRCQTLYIMPECLYYYRLNPLSMTKERKPFSWEGPELIGRHFEQQIPMDLYGFQDQVYRSVVHNLFNVAVSQFYRKESYQTICKDIEAHLKQPYYQNAIKYCKYRSIKGISAHMALKYRIYWLLKLKALHN